MQSKKIVCVSWNSGEQIRMFRAHEDALRHKAGDRRYTASEAYISDSRLVLQVHEDNLFNRCWSVVV